jgi:outer membrane lipoprotein-sorting protein
MKIFLVSILACISIQVNLFGQDATDLVKKVKAKLDKVNDYVADGKMKTNVAFIKAPVGTIKLYYKKPNKLKLIKQKGIAVMPKGGLTFNAATIFGFDNFTSIFAGEQVVSGVKTKIVRLLPNDLNSDLVQSVLYIDEANLLIKKSQTVTRENGSFETEMFYGTQAINGLPDKMILSFDLKEYKMPRGLTLEFEDNLTKEEKEKLKVKKGKLEITYFNYIINKGVDDSIFK